ncbi:putative toxin of the YafO-YafN toxin-antitoxin system [Shewanella benthica]|uniref:Putative toxin of the YafO-YafN toxin-antitoxin system n=1 Tax=Shewanella benthica TaxID=43661 RepID=A0A330LW02_9GAMM|nr:type II toxin-antitoxin system YafO family toxin [Shewanella benthica]SQH74376.1 putative toxin of the YafO-YafN toxin-antitoxin system [Shewanella benthica]
MTRVFKARPILDALTEAEQHQLVSDFKSYKEGELPELFGRDVLYDHPMNLAAIKDEEVRHLHLGNADAPWPIWKAQFNRTSDKHLVYCCGDTHPDRYLLMAILTPSAHDKAKDNNVMSRLGTMAEKFKEIH